RRRLRSLRRHHQDRGRRRLAGDSGLRHGAPERAQELRHRSGEIPGLRLRHGHRSLGDAEIRHAGSARLLRRRHALAQALRVQPVSAPRLGAGSGLMKFTLSWLKEHLATDASVGDIVERMTMTGLEVEAVEDAGEKLKAFTVAR